MKTRIRIFSQEEIRNDENVWMRHCIQFLRMGKVPMSFSRLPIQIQTARMKSFYQFLLRKIETTGTQRQRDTIDDRKNNRS